MKFDNIINKFIVEGYEKIVGKTIVGLKDNNFWYWNSVGSNTYLDYVSITKQNKELIEESVPISSKWTNDLEQSGDIYLGSSNMFRGYDHYVVELYKHKESSIVLFVDEKKWSESNNKGNNDNTNIEEVAYLLLVSNLDGYTLFSKKDRELIKQEFVGEERVELLKELGETFLEKDKKEIIAALVPSFTRKDLIESIRSKMVSIIEKLAKDFDGGNLQKVVLLEDLNLNNQKTMQ